MEMVPEVVIRLILPTAFGLWVYPACRCLECCVHVFSEHSVHLTPQADSFSSLGAFDEANQ